MDNADKLKYVDVNKQEAEVEVKSIVPLHDVVEGLKEKFPGLVHMRIPICNSASPLEKDFDTLCDTLVGTSINPPIILNDQVGLSRATTASVAACMFKEFQLSASYEGLVETVPGMDLSLLKMDRYKMDPNKDALFRGEFEIMDDAAQVFLKSKIMDNIHKYFYLIVFTAYMRQAADLARNSLSDEDKAKNALSGGKAAIPGDQLKISKTFVQFMEEHKGLRGMIDEGKGRLQWERDIPAAALSNLESLATTDFRANLGKIIHDIYQTAHTMFSDMPQGDHKKRAKYRFASKTTR